MKCPVRSALQKIEYAIRPFYYWLAPVLAVGCTYAVAYGATWITLSEKWQPYSAFFLIFAFLFTAFFLLIGAPCAIFSSVLSIMTILKKQHYVLPAIQLFLNGCLLVYWILTLRKYVL